MQDRLADLPTQNLPLHLFGRKVQIVAAGLFVLHVQNVTDELQVRDENPLHIFLKFRIYLNFKNLDIPKCLSAPILRCYNMPILPLSFGTEYLTPFRTMGETGFGATRLADNPSGMISNRLRDAMIKPCFKGKRPEP